MELGDSTTVSVCANAKVKGAAAVRISSSAVLSRAACTQQHVQVVGQRTAPRRCRRVAGRRAAHLPPLPQPPPQHQYLKRRLQQLLQAHQRQRGHTQEFNEDNHRDAVGIAIIVRLIIFLSTHRNPESVFRNCDQLPVFPTGAKVLGFRMVQTRKCPAAAPGVVDRLQVVVTGRSQELASSKLITWNANLDVALKDGLYRVDHMDWQCV